jgi:hypothetical protein
VEGVAKDFSKQLPWGGGLLAVGRVTLCLDWFAVLWRGWLKIVQNNPQGGITISMTMTMSPCITVTMALTLTLTLTMTMTMTRT